MENEREFKLIDGIFSVEEAQNILSALFTYKLTTTIKMILAITFDLIRISLILKREFRN